MTFHYVFERDGVFFAVADMIQDTLG